MPIYATVDSLTNSSSQNNYLVNANESYVTLFKLLTRAAIGGHVTRIAYSTGSAISGALGTGIDYRDTENSAGGNSWSVWRFNSSSYRDYEYYLMLGFSTFSSNWGSEPNQNFKFRNSTTLYSSVYMQLAAAFDPTTGATTNPWNGTTNNDGTDTCSSVVTGTFPDASAWTTGSAGYTLKVLPDVNNYPYSEVSASKGLFTYLSNGPSTATNPMHLNYFIAAGTEGDGLLVVYKQSAASTQWTWNYAGTFLPRPELTASFKVPIIINGEDEISADFSSTISTTLHNSGSSGILLTTETSLSDKPGLIDQNYWEKVGNLRWNTMLGTSPSQEIGSLGIYVNFPAGQGFVGTYPTLIQHIAGTSTDDLSVNENNIVFGASTIINYPKLHTAWSSSVGGPPGTHNHRTGSQF